MKISSRKNNTDGYITLISVLIVGAIGTSIVIALVLLGIGSSKTSIALEQSFEARSLATLCAEEALEQIRSNDAFSGTATLSIGNGDCEYTVINNGGESRTIESTGTAGNVIRRTEVEISQIYSTIQITNWVDVVDF